MSDRVYTQPGQPQHPPQPYGYGQPQYGQARPQYPPQAQYPQQAPRQPQYPQPQGRPQAYSQPRPQQPPQVQRISWLGAAKQFFYSKKIDKAGFLKNLTGLIVTLRAMGASATVISVLTTFVGFIGDDFVWVVFLVFYTPIRITWIQVRTNHPNWFTWLTR